MPESSAIAAMPVASAAVRALTSALAAKVSPVSAGNTTSSGSARTCQPGSRPLNSRTLCSLRVDKTSSGMELTGQFAADGCSLRDTQFCNALRGELKQLVERSLRERRAFGRCLNFDEPVVTGHHD